MKGQQKIFELFEANRDVFCEDIALKFSVSRLTVWKITEAVQGRSKYLRTVIQKMEICVLECRGIQPCSCAGSSKYRQVR